VIVLVGRNKRTIERTFKKEYGGFCGWKHVQETTDHIKNEDSLNIYVGLLQTGARAMELPSITRRQVDLEYSDSIIMINSMKVEKQRERINLFNDDGSPMLDREGKRVYQMKSVESERSFPIRRDNPLAGNFVEYIEKFDDMDILYPFTYNQIYYRIGLIDTNLPRGYYKEGWSKHKGPWWPHRIRAERACQLIRDYKYDLFRLKKWFGWSTSYMPELYGGIVPQDLIYENDVSWR